MENISCVIYVVWCKYDKYYYNIIKDVQNISCVIYVVWCIHNDVKYDDRGCLK